MSIDSMRVGGGRCPPLLVGGLVIACIMMVCNWWTLSSTNLELLRQIDELNEQIKISVEERDQCVTQRENFEKQLKTCQDNARTAHVKLSQVDDHLAQVDDRLNTCNEELKSYKSIDISKTATLEALRVDKKAISTQLDTKKEENKKLEEELKKVKNELEKAKMSMNAPPPKHTPLLPIPQLEKSQPDNKTFVNAGANSQVNAPPNAMKIDPQGQDLLEKDNSNIKDDTAAEVNDGANAIDPNLSFNLVSDPKGDTKKKRKMQFTDQGMKLVYST